MKHKCKELDAMLDMLPRLGFRLEFGGNCVKIYPPNKSKSSYTAHYGERAFHPVRRYLKNTCGVGI